VYYYTFNRCNLNSSFYDAGGGDALFLPTFILGFGHLEVNILISLGLGLISHIVSQERGKRETFGLLGFVV